MISANVRVLRPELLDVVDSAAAAQGLRDLVRINALLGGHRVMRSLFRSLEGPETRFSILDVGAASGDMGAALRCEFTGVSVTSLDRVPFHLDAAAPPRVAADAFRLPFPDRSFDYVTCSLFLHHFTNEEVVALLAAFRRRARRAVIALDLQRHPMAYHFLPATRWLMRWNKVTLHDGPRSVEAGFRPGELVDLATAAGMSDCHVRQHAPWFRVSLVAR